MKKLIIIFLCCNVYTFAQNRKEQIEQLTFKLDSTNTVLANERNSLNIKIIEMTKSIELLKKKIETTQTELASKQTEIENLNNQIEKSKNIDFEIEKWKKELIINNELGKPCSHDNTQKWMDENPYNIFGVSNDLTINRTDFNNDGMEDAFVSMSVDACTYSNATTSEYSVLIFSDNGEYYKNVKLTEQIHRAISNEFAEKGISNLWKLTIYDQSFDGRNIIGRSSIWFNEDPNCCPSYIGTFQYNPISRDMKLDLQKQ